MALRPDDFSLRLHAALEAGADTMDVADGPHVCASCRTPFVTPTDALELDEWHFAVSVRCPNCGWEGSAVYDDAALERFDIGLDQGTHALAEALALLALENARGDFDRFLAALDADAILPEDF